MDDDLLEAILNLPDVDLGRKVLLEALLSFAGEFALPEKTLIKRSGLSESTLKRQRKRLNELGYIKYIPYKEYYVDIDKIRNVYSEKERCLREP
uniref:Z DNA-binding protein n=1 Tax=Siphoviridae sp. ctTnV63 TaxID=2825523 RepID=A0A8S5NW28_9CAUD|nr:MAG TPA: Z DNA-binding protein [Siphoviridae sp. ctTnV63]